MRVAIVSKADANSGGAGKMAANLASWLGDAGHEVTSVLAQSPAGPGVVAGRTRLTRLGKSLEVRVLMNEQVPFDYPPLKRALDRIGPDVVHVHDISRAYSIDAIRWVARHRPTVWTMHDQSAMTGGCISPIPCTRWEVGCGSCPKLGAWSLQGRFDMTARAWRRKRTFHQEGRAVLAAPSRWAADRFAASPAFRSADRVHVVPNAIGPAEINHIGRDVARRKLGIPLGRFTMLIISHDLNDLAKNPTSQQRAVASLADLDPLLMLMGNSSIEYERAFAPIEVRGVGFVSDARYKRLVYAAADVFVNTSLSDTFSLTTLESLATGTPVVAYASGGIPEILTDRCGVLVEPDNGAALGEAIRELATSGIPPDWGANARTRAREFSPIRHVAEYMELYELAISRFGDR